MTYLVCLCAATAGALVQRPALLSKGGPRQRRTAVAPRMVFDAALALQRPASRRAPPRGGPCTGRGSPWSFFRIAPRMAVARSYKPSKCSGTPVRRTLAESAALPVLFVGSGSFLLAKKGAEEEEEAAAEGGEVDFYRDTPVRFAGYANEVGESFAPLVPAWIVPASYGVAIFYVVADTVDKVTKALNGDKYGPKDVTSCALIEGLDALIWQLAASVALPGYTIHQLVAVVIASMAALGVTPGESAVIDAIPTVLGLATIPFIVKPLDELAEELMDVTLRKIWEPYLEECSVDYSR